MIQLVGQVDMQLLSSHDELFVAFLFVWYKRGAPY